MLRHVTRLHDPALTAYRNVGDPSALTREGLFVAEGRLVVERLIADGRFRAHSVVVTPAAAVALRPALAARPELPVHVCDPAVLREITGFDFHRGCLALAWREERQVPAEELCLARRVVAIEGVGNPDNIGGLFRAAFTLGVDAILLDPTAADPFYRKAIRTSMGATLRVPYSRARNWPDDVGALRSHGFRILALTPHPDAVPLEDVCLAADARTVLVVGSEGSGLTAALLAHADTMVRIRIDSRADSLNVVVAAAIALHALR